MPHTRPTANRLRHIAIATSTRADWGLLHPVASLLRKREDVDLQIIVANMHLDVRRGHTIDEIIADGFTPAATVPVFPADDSRLSVALAMAETLKETALVLNDLAPDLLLVLGDRYEMLAIASAASAMQIPLAHISGGEITEGAIDDSFRHAISKLASLHFATTEEHRQRLIAMGEPPGWVFNTGALGVSNVRAGGVDPTAQGVGDARARGADGTSGRGFMSRGELEADLGFSLGDHPVIVTFHPATNDPIDPAVRFAALLEALDRHPELSPLFTYPNNDAGGDRLIAMTEDWVARHDNAHAVPSLGRVRYLSALKCVEAVIGNSSSGLVEVPSAGIPTVDIGCRQHRRTAGASVIHCGDSADEIFAAIDKAMSPEFKALAARCDNPYYQADTPAKIVDLLLSVNPRELLPKRFYDIDRQPDRGCPVGDCNYDQITTDDKR